MERTARRRRGRRVALDAWPTLLALLLCLPLLTRAGHPLARDLVFVPRQPFSEAAIGLGHAAPRSVPLDAVVALLDDLVDGGVLARIVLPLLLALAGWGAHRLVPSLGTVGRLAAGGFAVWNPFVVERLALGQWALLAGYAALPWVLLAARRYAGSGRLPDLGATAGWLGLASLTPTGGLVGGVVALVAAAGRGSGRRVLAPLAVAGILQMPWLLPSVLGSAAATSDPDGVRVFAASPEGPGGVLTALLGLGGIWDADSVPATRDGWWGPVSALVAVLVLVAARRSVLADPALRRLSVLGAIGLLLAAAWSLPGGESAGRWLVESVPGAGLLRDSHKFLAPYATLVAVAVGLATDRLARAAARAGREIVVAVALLAVPLPLVLLPDGAATTWSTLEPVRYPSGLDAVERRLEGEDGDLATLPWRSYRLFSWGNGRVSSDPATRWFDRPVLVSDDLQVGEDLVEGESVRADRLGAALEDGPVRDALAPAGVRWALVYLDDPDADALDLSGLERVLVEGEVALYEVPGATTLPRSPGPATRAAVLGSDGLALLVVVLGGGLAARAARNGRRATTGLLGSAKDL